MPDNAIEKIEKKGKELVDKLFGAPKKAAEAINKAPAKLDKEVKKQTGDASQGVDKGELGKPYEKAFDFYK
jgi:hypothetical protein